MRLFEEDKNERAALLDFLFEQINNSVEIANGETA
jgi:hypothetical protein